MKKTFLLILVAALAAAIPVPAGAANSGSKAEIERLSNEFAAAWNVHDANRMAAVWAEDGDVINPFGQSAHGRTEIEKFFEKEQATVMKGTTYKIESIVIRDLGPTVAAVDWESVVTGMADASGKPLPPFKHHAFAVCLKKNGHWHAAASRVFAFAALPGAPVSK